MNQKYFAAVQHERSCRTRRVCLVIAVLLALLAMKELGACKNRTEVTSPAVFE